MYKVEFWSDEDNGWIQSSFHRNLDHAQINVQVLLQGGKPRARIITHGKIIEQTERQK